MLSPAESRFTPVRFAGKSSKSDANIGRDLSERTARRKRVSGMTQRTSGDRTHQRKNAARVLIISSAAVTGSRVIPSEEVDRAFGMPIGKLRSRAGIESVAYVAPGETEVTLGTHAAQEALHAAGCGPKEIDSIVATSETHHIYPSLAAQLHSSVAARETCGAFDVGGACLGLVNSLAVAQS